MARIFTREVDICNQCPNFVNLSQGHVTVRVAARCTALKRELDKLYHGVRRYEIPNDCPLPEKKKPAD